jgi:predicted nucleotidyltransferase
LSQPIGGQVVALRQSTVTLETQWRLFEKEDPPRVKHHLYVYRVLLTGIHLMQTGVV